MKNKTPKCKNCWDKGYASQLVNEVGYPDFYGDKGFSQVKEIKNYCNCAKGKRMKREANKPQKEKIEGGTKFSKLKFKSSKYIGGDKNNPQGYFKKSQPQEEWERDFDNTYDGEFHSAWFIQDGWLVVNREKIIKYIKNLISEIRKEERKKCKKNK